MLYIEQHTTGNSIKNTWHISEPVPQIDNETRVITFQADGDELNLILNAMRRSRSTTDAAYEPHGTLVVDL